MRFVLVGCLLFLMMGCYSSPSDDYLDTIPRTNNSAFIPPSNGGQGAPQMPQIPGLGGPGQGE